MKFDQFRPTAHFIAPHSWSNDPCGAVYIPEIKEYLFCYQWNPGTTEGGNSAWGMARSKDLVTWEDCSPAIRNSASYDSHGVFSGSIVSRLVDEKRALYLFYTSVSALPIHWSKYYIEGCETQSVAFSTDLGKSWQRYENNPVIRVPPKLSLTTGWRDPFVSPWESLSKLLGVDPLTDYMMVSSGERGRGPQLHLYRSTNLLEWKPLSTILDVEFDANVSATTGLNLARNFECSSFFTLDRKDYLIVGLEEDSRSSRHNGHVNIVVQVDCSDEFRHTRSEIEDQIQELYQLVKDTDPSHDQSLEFIRVTAVNKNNDLLDWDWEAAPDVVFLNQQEIEQQNQNLRQWNWEEAMDFYLPNLSLEDRRGQWHSFLELSPEGQKEQLQRFIDFGIGDM